MLERRVERYREGDIVYPLQNHIVIIGFDNMVPTLSSKFAMTHIMGIAIF